MPNNTRVSYIDTTYYTQSFKPDIRSSIQDKYTNGLKNAANFESYSERASEAINRLTNNTIEGVVGGFNLLPPTAKALTQKATAALVAYWFLYGFNIGIINTTISNQVVKGKQVKVGNTMRAFIPETVLWLIQSSGLTDQTFLGVESEEFLINNVIPGFSINDFFTKSEQLALFQEKGDYDNNFHKDIVIQDELSGTTDKRYFLIGKSQPAQKTMTFSYLGGNELGVTSAKQIVSITRFLANDDIDFSESSVVTLNPKANDLNVSVAEPEVLVNINSDNEIQVFIETKSDKDLADILITDITPDDNSEYGLFSSSLNDPTATLLQKLAVVQSSGTTGSLQSQITQNEQNIQTNKDDIGKIDLTPFAKQTDLTTNINDIKTNKDNIQQNTDDITYLRDTEIVNLKNDKIEESIANSRFIHRDPQLGTTEAQMDSTYVPTQPFDVMTKNVHDADKQTLEGSISATDTIAQAAKDVTDVIEPKVTANETKIISIQTDAKDLKDRVDIIEPATQTNTLGVTDYNNNKADFVRTEDLQGAINVVIANPITMTEDGGDVVADLTVLNSAEIATLEKFVDGRLMVIQVSPNDPTAFPTEYARDSWNNGATTSNSVLGRDIEVSTTFSADGVTPIIREIRLTGLIKNDRDNFINDFKITELSQVGSVAGANVDNIARTTANTAQVTANEAKVESAAANTAAQDASTKVTNLVSDVTDNTSKITTNKTDIGTNKTGIATNVTNISKNVTDIGTNKTNITKNATDIVNVNADLDELNKGKFDVNGDGTKITEIFDANGDLDTPIKDLIHLTTQDELYNAVEAGGIYKITISNQIQLVFCPTKTATQAFIKAFVAKQDAVEVIRQTATKGNTSNFNWLVSTMIIGTPTLDTHATTKHYVDNEISKFVEKTITIPAEYGWKTVNQKTDLNPSDSGKKAKISFSDTLISPTPVENTGFLKLENNFLSWSSTSALPMGSNSSETFITYYSWGSTSPSDNDAVTFGQAGKPRVKSTITKFEIWDEITPAQNIKVLEKV